MFRFEVRSKSQGLIESFERPLFTLAHKSLLQQFAAANDALNDTSFVQNWSNTHISIHLPKTGQPANNGSLPTHEQIAAFLHRLRPIYLNNEDTNFDKVANIVSRHLNHSWVTTLIREGKRYYSGKALQDIVEIKSGNMLITSGQYLDHYLNALEYHRDAARREHIDRIAKNFPLDAQKPIVVLLLAMKLSAINKLSSFLLGCFERENGEILTLQVE